jgi:hypothetical protein
MNYEGLTDEELISAGGRSVDPLVLELVKRLSAKTRTSTRHFQKMVADYRINLKSNRRARPSSSSTEEKKDAQITEEDRVEDPSQTG